MVQLNYGEVLQQGVFMRKALKINMDNLQRISLTRLLSKEERELYCGFKAYKEDGKIVLEPMVEVPAREHWIFKNPEALSSLEEGIEDAKKGKLKSRGSFSKYVKE